MPIVEPSSYSPPLFFSNGHWQTIFPHFFRRVKGVKYRRERIDIGVQNFSFAAGMQAPPSTTAAKSDFLDLDWSFIGAERVAIVSHGLEGNSGRSYVLGMVRALNRAGWDVLAWNFRGCSGEPNRQLRSYHSGATEDLHAVINHAISRKRYQHLALVGFSLGGNLTLKYLGERGEAVDARIKRAVTISVPCDLAGSSRKMARPGNQIYMRRFLKMLHQKIKAKMEILPGLIDDAGFEKIKNFQDFDDRYTAPLHGFSSAEDYWEKCSSRQFLPRIAIPTLVINARNDPFLNEECFPIEEARRNPNLFLEMPESGGHVGFVEFNSAGEYWSERRAVGFLNDF